jgi:DNA polymerase
MKPIAIDFETYYDSECSVRALGNYHYMNHPEWDALLLAIYGDELQGVYRIEDVPWSQLSNRPLIAHNAGFEQGVLNRLKEQDRAPDLFTTRWHDTADLAAYLGAPRNLEGAARTLLNIKLDKGVRDEMKGKRVMQDKFKEYALGDAEACFNIWTCWSQYWPSGEQELSRLTLESAQSGLSVDTVKLEKSISDLGNELWRTARDIPWAGNSDAKGKPIAVTSSIALCKECRARGIEPPPTTNSKDPDFLKWFADNPIDFVVAVQKYRSLNKTLKLLQTMLQRVKPNGRMDAGLKYFGAHTGRWAGWGGLNLQNLPREGDVRGMIVPGPDKKFIIADLAQIEPRCMAWMVDDVEFLNKCRDGQSPYEAHARSTMGYSGPAPLKTHSPSHYALAKARVLGLGYGCGHKKFVDVARALAGLKISESESKTIVVDYRNTNPLIVQYWKKLERAFKREVQFESGYFNKLPSGRQLRYFNCKSHKGLYASVQRGQPPRKIWGGVLCENQIQALARDVFANILLRLNIHGWHIAFHVHDEVILEVNKSVDIEEVKAVMCEPISWVPDLPIDVDACESEYFKK